MDSKSDYRETFRLHEGLLGFGDSKDNPTESDPEETRQDLRLHRGPGNILAGNVPTLCLMDSTKFCQ